MAAMRAGGGAQPQAGVWRPGDQHGGEQLAGAQKKGVHGRRAGALLEQPRAFAVSGGKNAPSGQISTLNHPKILGPYPKCINKVVAMNCNTMISKSEPFVEGEVLSKCTEPLDRSSWKGKPRQVTAPVGMLGDQMASKLAGTRDVDI